MTSDYFSFMPRSHLSKGIFVSPFLVFKLSSVASLIQFTSIGSVYIELGTTSKNNLRGITLVTGPLCGIHSLTLIISWQHLTPLQNLDVGQMEPFLRCLIVKQQYVNENLQMLSEEVRHVSSPRKSVLSLARPNFLTGAIIETRFQASLIAPRVGLKILKSKLRHWKAYCQTPTSINASKACLGYKAKKQLSQNNKYFQDIMQFTWLTFKQSKALTDHDKSSSSFCNILKSQLSWNEDRKSQ